MTDTEPNGQAEGPPALEGAIEAFKSALAAAGDRPGPAADVQPSSSAEVPAPVAGAPEPAATHAAPATAKPAPATAKAAPATAKAVPAAAKAVPAETAAGGARQGRRKVREGIVASNAMDKTAVVVIIERVRHPRYAKTVQRTKRLYAHDETNDTRVGDRVRLTETRPLSKLKRWRVEQVLERAR
jgi:small subunit ribosomal protein S17